MGLFLTAVRDENSLLRGTCEGSAPSHGTEWALTSYNFSLIANGRCNICCHTVPSPCVHPGLLWDFGDRGRGTGPWGGFPSGLCQLWRLGAYRFPLDPIPAQVADPTLAVARSPLHLTPVVTSVDPTGSHLVFTAAQRTGVMTATAVASEDTDSRAS